MEGQIFRFSRIAIPTLHGKKFILKSEILFCEADGSYTKFFMLDPKAGFIHASMELGECAKQLLPEDGFLRIHHSLLINMNHAVGYEKGKHPNVVLINNIKLAISDTYRHAFLQAIENKTQKKLSPEF